MSFKVKDLESALFRLGHLSNRELIFVVWTDTGKDCKPIAKVVGITFPKTIKDETARNIIRGMNSKVWVLAIIDDHKNVYEITLAKEFAEKSCKEEKVLVLKKKLNNEEVIHIEKSSKPEKKGEKKLVRKRKTSSS